MQKSALQPQFYLQLQGCSHLIIKFSVNNSACVNPVALESIFKLSSVVLVSQFSIFLYPLTLIPHNSANLACVSFCLFLILFRLSLTIYSHLFTLTSIKLHTGHLKLQEHSRRFKRNYSTACIFSKFHAKKIKPSSYDFS